MTKIVFPVVILVMSFVSTNLVYAELKEEEIRSLMTDNVSLKKDVEKIKVEVESIKESSDRTETRLYDLSREIGGLRGEIEAVKEELNWIREKRLPERIWKIETTIKARREDIEVGLAELAGQTGKGLAELKGDTEKGLAEIRGELKSTNLWLQIIFYVVIGGIAFHIAFYYITSRVWPPGKT